jgi:hypothetical protein
MDDDDERDDNASEFDAVTKDSSAVELVDDGSISNDSG